MRDPLVSFGNSSFTQPLGEVLGILRAQEGILCQEGGNSEIRREPHCRRDVFPSFVQLPEMGMTGRQIGLDPIRLYGRSPESLYRFLIFTGSEVNNGPVAPIP
jgi:hypothetical protein